MGMNTQETQQTLLDMSLLAEIQAEAARFTKNFGRPKLELIKGGRDSQNVTKNDKNCPAFAAACMSKASKAKFRGGLVLLCYEGERDKKRNGVAAMQRRRLKVIRGGKLTQAEELQIMALIAEWNGLQELKRLRGEK